MRESKKSDGGAFKAPPPGSYRVKHPKIIPKLNTSVNNNQIDQVDEFNFLGIAIDQSVTWVSHIREIFLKISRVIGILRK